MRLKKVHLRLSQEKQSALTELGHRRPDTAHHHGCRDSAAKGNLQEMAAGRAPVSAGQGATGREGGHGYLRGSARA
jgi:hypothetical protein